MGVQIGVNAWTWVSPLTTEKARTLFPKIKQMGFDIVELPLEDPSNIEPRETRALLEASGLGATVCGAFGPNRDLASEDAGVVRNALEYIEQCLTICEGVGAKLFVGPLYSAVGKARQVPAGQRQKEFDQSCEQLRKAAIIAADRGVTLGIEPLNRFETDMVNTAARAMEMVRAVNHPNVGVHLDTFHMNIEEECVYDAVVSTRGHLVHVHASESHRGTPGKGTAGWDDLARGLKEIGYDGPVVIETFTPEVKEIARAAAIWRPLAASQDALAADGLAFLRTLLA